MYVRVLDRVPCASPPGLARKTAFPAPPPLFLKYERSMRVSSGRCNGEPGLRPRSDRSMCLRPGHEEISRCLAADPDVTWTGLGPRIGRHRCNRLKARSPAMLAAAATGARPRPGTCAGIRHRLPPSYHCDRGLGTKIAGRRGHYLIHSLRATEASNEAFQAALLRLAPSDSLAALNNRNMV